MFIFTAEAADGEIVMISAPSTRERFIAAVSDHLADIAEPGAPTELTLYEWLQEDLAMWLHGTPFGDNFTSWPQMAREACFGRVAYVFPGRYAYLEVGQEEPRPSAGWMAANAPVTEDDLDGYSKNDPKRWTLEGLL